MSKISTKIATSLISLIILFTISYASDFPWPVKSQIDLSSGFGDFRNSRFHAGVDIRTGGIEGKEIFSPADGYVWRIFLSYKGYGKGLYIKGDDGYLYVFGHLKDFNDDINLLVKKRQMADERYYQDLYFPADSIRVSQGQLIAFSGQTGSNAPHLHFEKRSPDNFPLNPLTHGFNIKDKARPVFTRIGFQLTDTHSLFYNGNRKVFLEVTPGHVSSLFSLDTIPYFNSPFGVYAECFDRIRTDGMKQTVYKLTLQIDGKTYYQVVFDTLDFEKGRLVNFEYDSEKAAQDNKLVRCLFSRTGNEYNGSRALDEFGGIIGLQPGFEIGFHQGKIIAEDCNGNKSELQFKFLWGPPSEIFHLDSTVTVNDSLRYFCFTPTVNYKKLDIDTVYVLRCWGPNWLNDTLNHRIYKMNPEVLMIESKGQFIERHSLKLVIIGNKKTYIEDKPFHGIVKGYSKGLDIVTNPLDEGLVLIVTTPANFLGDMFLRVYSGDKMVEEKYPDLYFNAEQYYFFLPPDKKYAVIDSLGVALNFADGSVYNRLIKKVNIRLAGVNPVENIAVDSLFTLNINAENFYQPRFITWQKKEIARKSVNQMNSELYRIFPEVMVTRQNLKVTLKLNEKERFNNQSGLCWLDETKNRWVWLEDNLFEANSLTASSVGGGSLAAVFDFELPVIKDLSLKNGDLISDRQPLITFILEDTLSGFADDRSIIIKIDDKWMIPEYNPQTRICQTRPVEPLSQDKHTLKIEAVDRAGNKVEKFIQFKVIIKSKPNKN